MVSLFWKKLTLINVALFVSILKIYGYYVHMQEKKQLSPSLYPEEDDNGYSFLDQINCDLKSIFKMAYELSNTTFITDSNKVHNTSIMRTCKLDTRLLLCKDNYHCHQSLYNHHKYDADNHFKISDEYIIWNSLDITNCFHYTASTIHCQGIAIYNDLITGYQTYKSLQEHMGNITYIKDHITSSYHNLNSLLHFVSLTMKISLEFDDNTLQLNHSFYQSTADNCLQYNPINTSVLTEKQRIGFFTNIDNFKEILSCTRLSSYSYTNVIRDIEAIESIYKRIFDISIDQRNESENVLRLLRGLITTVDYLLKEEFALKEMAMNNDFDKKLFNVIFWGFSVMIILFINRYFLKNQEYYSSKSKTFFGKGKTYSPGSYISKTINNKKKGMKDNYKGQVYTQDEIDRISKMDTIEDSEFIMTK